MTDLVQNGILAARSYDREGILTGTQSTSLPISLGKCGPFQKNFFGIN